MSSLYSSPKDGFKKLFNGIRGTRLSVKERMFLVRRLAFLMRADVPLLESLDMLKVQSTSISLSRILADMSKDVERGHSLSRSMRRYPKVFGEFGIHIIAIGESSGTLPRTLEYFADELKKNHALTRKVMSACIYPAVITGATFAITGFLMIYLFPRIMPVFFSLHMKLPLTTRIVMALSSFLVQWGVFVLVFLVAVMVLAVAAPARSERVRHLYDYLSLHVPFAGMMVRNYHLASTTRTLGLLLSSGIPIFEAVPLTANTATNLLYKSEYRMLAESISRGERISSYLVRTPFLFPSVLTQMVEVGERSGTLTETLLYLSELYEAEVDEFSRNLSSLIEPALMIIMGLVVGFISISIITPIYGITQNLHP